MEKIGVFLGGFRILGRNRRNGEIKGRRWCGDERWWLRDAVVVMGNGGWRRNGGFGGVWEKRDRDGGGKVCTVRWKWGRESEQ
jgi:hypothetical protein